MGCKGNGEAKEGQFFLGEVHFKKLDSGRVHCVETGHDLPESQKAAYGKSKKCRLALLNLFLDQKKPPLNFFKHSASARDKVTCSLTGDTLNKLEEAIWKHMMGQKFQRKLAEKEKHKNIPAKSRVEHRAKHCEVRHISEKQTQSNEDCIGIREEEMHAGDSSDAEEPDFWVPPDVGRQDVNTGMVEMLETDLGSQDDIAVRTKRMASESGSSGHTKKMKKKRKAVAD